MKNRLTWPSPSVLVAVIGLVVAMSGVAVAANKIGGKDIKANAIKTSKIKNGAVTGPKLAAGAVSAANLAPGSVTAPVLAAGERSEAFTATHPQVSMAAATDAVVIQAELPEGSFLFTVSAQLGNQAATAQNVHCDLLDGDNPVATADVPLAATAVFQGSFSLTGASDGGVVRLRCKPETVAATARNLFLTAVKVGSVTPLTSTP